MPQFTKFSDSDLDLLILIRQFELSLLELFSQGKLNGTTHTCVGQEYIAVALKHLLKPTDFIFSNHRGHGHYLARYRDATGLLAEIMGKAGAICNGVGGSQHIYRENYLSTGIQGESLPVATGVAMHLKRKGNQDLALAYIGDGTWGEGAVYESLNLAKLWQLPLMVVVENNNIAQSTPKQLNMAGTIEARVRAFDIDFLKISTLDINQIREQVAPLIASARASQSPLVLEFETYRVGPHSKGDDTRTEAELKSVYANDWYQLYRQQYPEQFQKIFNKVEHEVKELIAEIEQRPLTKWNLNN